MAGLQVTGGGPGGYGPGGGGPPGGGYGPPLGGGGGGYGGRPPGGYGGPPMPPTMPPAPPQSSGPNVGLIVGPGCLGFFVLGALGVGALAFFSYRRASAMAIPTTVAPPRRSVGAGATPPEATSSR